jgi:hypothetical protein
MGKKRKKEDLQPKRKEKGPRKQKNMSTDAARARAHYKWADRYKVQGEYKKSEAHFVRGKHYDRRRRSAFGADPDLVEPPKELNVMSIAVVAHLDVEYGTEADDTVIKDMVDQPRDQIIHAPPDDHQTEAVDSLLRAEFLLNGARVKSGPFGYAQPLPVTKRDTEAPASAISNAKARLPWFALRYKGCIYLARVDPVAITGADTTNPSPDDLGALAKVLLKKINDRELPYESIEKQHLRRVTDPMPAAPTSNASRTKVKPREEPDPDWLPKKNDLMIVEDWRASMLMTCHIDNGTWTGAEPHHAYMYHDFMIRSNRSNPIARTYCNRAHLKWCNDRYTEHVNSGHRATNVDASVATPNQAYKEFNVVNDGFWPKQDLYSRILGMVSSMVRSEPPRFCFTVTLTRSADNEVCIENILDKSKMLHDAVYVMPASLVKDSMWISGAHMHPHWACMILGVTANKMNRDTDRATVQKVFDFRMKQEIGNLIGFGLDPTAFMDNWTSIEERCTILNHAVAALTDTGVGCTKGTIMMLIMAEEGRKTDIEAAADRARRAATYKDKTLADAAARAKIHKPISVIASAYSHAWNYQHKQLEDDRVADKAATAAGSPAGTVAFGNHRRKPHRRTTKT